MTGDTGWLLGVGTLALASATWAWAGVAGSKHDFAHRDWAGGDTCGACHSPHHEEPPAAAPLWDPQADLNRRFGTSLVGGAQAGAGTLICLRCHDGTIAKDAVSGQVRARFVHTASPGLFGAGHGTSDHPVGIVYPEAKEGFHPLNVVLAKGTVTLPDGRVECTSCHDPHDTSGAPYMLVTSNARSALCLTCHKK